MSKLRIFMVWIGFTVAMGFFQNCGDGFNAISDLDGNFGEAGSQGPGSYSFDTFQDCSQDVGLENLTSCLQKRKALPQGLSQEIVNNCITQKTKNHPDSDFHIAHCLAKQSFPPEGYRVLSQFDVNECLSKVDNSEIATCLKNKGILPDTVSQDNIDNCIQSDGEDQLEQCLRKSSTIEDPMFLTQRQVNRCEVLFGEKNIKECLIHRQVVPKSLSQDDLNFCLSNANFGLSGLVRCLRSRQVIPSIIMQSHIQSCGEQMGNDGFNVTRCLIDNGLLTTNNLGQNQDFYQSLIEGCLENPSRGFDNLSACLRSENIESILPNNFHFHFCARVAGPDNIVDCLKKNEVLPYGIDASHVAACVNRVGEQGDVTGCLNDDGVLIDFNTLNAQNGFFRQNCYTCHGPSASPIAGGIRVFDYDYLIENRLIIANDIDNSLIWQRISTNNNQVMPPTGFLGNEDIEIVKRWILQGAILEYPK